MLDSEKLKKLKAVRIRRLFIETTTGLIREYGMEGLSIRKISEIVGYNSATTYNYFEDLEHLITLASLKFLDAYTADLSKIMFDNMNSMERYIQVIGCFAFHSFSMPEVYYQIFYGKYSNKLSDIILEYYEIYPEELKVKHFVVRDMLFAGSMIDREHRITEQLYQDGFITREDQQYLVEIAISLHEYLLRQLCQAPDAYKVAEMIQRYKACLTHVLRLMKQENTPFVVSLGK